MRRAVVMFSSGLGSWAAAQRAKDSGRYDDITLLFADTNTEDADNYRFLHEAADDLDLPLVTIDNDGATIWDVFAGKYGRTTPFLGNTRVDPCSEYLKRKPMRQWVEDNRDPADTTVIIGFGWEEPHRFERAKPHWRPWVIDAPMVREPYLGRAALMVAATDRGLRPPRLYSMANGALSHANCGGLCVKAGQAQFARAFHDPDLRPVFDEWERQENKLREELGDVAILRDRRGGKTKPLPLSRFRVGLEQSPTLFDPTDAGSCSCLEPPLDGAT